MNLFHILILAVVQGLAELLPVSSSAHVIVAAKLLGMDPLQTEDDVAARDAPHGNDVRSNPLFLEGLEKKHVRLPCRVQATGRQTSDRDDVNRLRLACHSKRESKKAWRSQVTWSRTRMEKLPRAEIELLFDNLGLIAGALFAVGVLILIAGRAERTTVGDRDVGIREAAWIGAIQGLCLPFRGFSRSGATISTGLLLGVLKSRAEEFSFALAVIITPATIGREVGD